MKKKIIHIAIIITIISIGYIILPQNYIYAKSQENIEISKEAATSQIRIAKITEIPNANTFDPRNKTIDVDKELLTKANKIIGWVESIGVIVSVIVLAVLGIKYMVGSVEEKADYKQNMKIYVIGFAVTFGVMTILKLISDFVGLIK